jgi:hypothetical protein
MAISEFLEPAIKDYAGQAKATYSAPIDTSTFAQKVAPQDAMTTQAAGIASQGVGSYTPYLQAAQQAQATGAGALGQSASTIGGIGANIGQAGTTLGGVGTNIGQADTSLANAQSAYGGLGAFQTAGGNIAQGAAGMTGANAYQPFMSPYQQQVIDATLSEFDRSRLGGQQQIRDAAVGSGNFGGGREGAMMGQYNADSLVDRSALQAQMLQQGFGQAQQAAQQNFQNQGDLYGMQSNLFNQQAQMGGAQQGLAQSQLGQGAARQSLAQSQLGQGDALARQAAAQQGLAGAYGNQMNQQFGLSDFDRQGMGQDINALGTLGAANQAQVQAQLNADRMNNQTAAYEPYGRLSQYGNTLTGLAGGVAGQQYQQEEAADPYASALAGATGVAGLFGQIYGGRRY